MSNNKTGAVLVVGGGIAGIQASLDLAESGFKVYLLEKDPSIGGKMPQLDKTFPTNDCAMCTLAPKLVETGRHQNIELITYAELEDVEGEAGNFKVKIKKHPSFVDFSKCTGCSECEKVCPVELKAEFNEGIDNRHAIFRLYPQAIPNVFAIDKKEEKSPCKLACPTGVNAQGYVQLISQGKFQEAVDLVRERNPFPGICGRVCHHPCEEECLRATIDSPVAIRALKRFVVDWELKQKAEGRRQKAELNGKRVAIVGGGPGGLTAAYDLRQSGYQVTIFEKAPFLGGMMRLGIPAYRLPRDILQKEIDLIIESEIEVKLNTEVGKDIKIDDLKNEFDAVLLAIGAHLPKRLPIEGVDKEGVYSGIPLLRSLNMGEKVNIGDNVLVIGGGNVAIDCARCSLRSGASEVHLACLEAASEMPAHPWEIKEAVEEGIIIHNRIGPKRVLGDGKARGLEALKVKRVFDEKGRFRPVFEEGTEHILDCDTLVIAIGQEPDFFLLEGTNIESTRYKTIAADPITLSTSREGIFSCGDATTGPASVVKAIDNAHEAVISIDRYLRGEDLKEGREKREEKRITEVWRKNIEREEREEPLKLEPAKRKRNFDEIEQCLSEEQAIKEAKRCLSCSVCSECMQCVETCKAGAIDHQMKGERIELDVGSIILTPGFDKFDPHLKHEYGYGRYKNVLTSLQFERILSASGPFEGHLQRLSDGKEPGSIAWIQCVGSRDAQVGNQYCSSVCCTYAVKEAVIAKEHAKGELKTTIFYMDMRTFGKGFEEYYDRARDEYGVNFVRGRVSGIVEHGSDHNLTVRYTAEDGKIKEAEFGLVVLSVGMRPPERVKELAKVLKIKLNEFGFARTMSFFPLETTRPGVFVAGAFAGPKDIPETVMQASGSSAKAGALIAEARGSEVTKKTYPPEIDLSSQEPRIGVFVCHCGINIGGVVDVPSTVEYARTLPDVVYAEDNLYTCSEDTQKKITEVIKEQGLNRVIVASCTPRTHEPLFRETCREAGLNPYLFEMANIRDQCSWVHASFPEIATIKAKDLVRMATAKARLLEPLHAQSVGVTRAALVVGGGLTGMTAALDLASQGFEVHLVEKKKELGGFMRRIHFSLNGDDPQKRLEELIDKVSQDEKIHLYTDAAVSNIEGFVGNFKSGIRDQESGIREIEHGVVIVATGAEELKPKEYLYGEDERVITQLELEEKLAILHSAFRIPHSIVMIQCVGSRQGDRPYCSRVCCQQAIKNALKLKKINPEAEVYILHRDVRSYGFSETYYQKAREAGVIFIRYDEDRKPDVSKNGDRLKVGLKDPVIGQEVIIDPDLLVLSPAIVPQEGNFELSQMLKSPLDANGFFLEAHMKLRPVDCAVDGIFLAGLSHSPKTMEESISQASAAAGRAVTVLAKNELLAEATVSMVKDDSKCRGCEKCKDGCEYNAIEMVEYIDGSQVSRINPAVCKGCGACAAICPAGAIKPQHFDSQKLNAMVDAAMAG